MRSLVIGVDLGTSGVRAVAVDRSGLVVGSAAGGYHILAPSPGYAEQDPEEWWRSTCQTLRECIAMSGHSTVEGIGFSGQMHGTVLIDSNGGAIRPAIIWPDQRSGESCRRFVARVGADWLAARTQNSLATGFQLASLLWLSENDPSSLARAFRVLLPKDFIRGRMSGVWATEPSDACSTLAFDCTRFAWADDVIAAAGIRRDLFPECRSSCDFAGCLEGVPAAETGLPGEIPLFMGGGDTPSTALGSGVLSKGQCMVTIGSGGQLVAPLDTPQYDAALRTNTFCHVVPHTWYAMGAILSAGLSLKWLREKILGPDAPDFARLAESAEHVPPGAEGLIFLPYLTGERTPHMNPDACGVFFGLTPRHTAAHMVRAVMEGVAMALADGLDIVRSLGVTPESVFAAGGGAHSQLWRQILANVFDCPIAVSEDRERAAIGAAIVAATGIGWFENLEKASDAWRAPVKDVAAPQAGQVEHYRGLRALFRQVYSSLEECMAVRAESLRHRQSDPDPFHWSSE